MLAGEKYDVVQSSPLSRAWLTMELAGFGGQASENSELVEWDYGEYEGVSTAEVRREIPEWTVWTHPISDGEALEDVGARADRVIDDFLDHQGRILLFGHGQFLRILAARWVGMAPSAGRRIALSTATVSTLGWERETRVIDSWNVACHLPSDDPLL